MPINLRQASPKILKICRSGALNVCQRSSATIEAPDGASKRFEDIPEPNGKWPFLGHSLMIMRGAAKGSIHKDMAKISSEVGDVAKLDIMGVPHLILRNPIHLEELYRKETKYPSRPPNFSWTDYRTDHGEAMGLLTSEEEHWKRMRGVISKHMMPPKTTIPYFDPILNVTCDFVRRLDKLRDNNGFVDKLPNELYKWSMEAIGTVLFQRRLGNLEEPIDPRSQKFIEYVNEMLYSTSVLYAGYNLQKKYKSKWFRKHNEAWNFIFDFARYYINEHLEKIEKGHIKNPEGDFLVNLLMNPNLSKQEVISNATELLLAGVDTTSNSICFNLYLLSQNLEKQKKLIREIDEVIGDGLPTNDSFKNMPYLRCVMKESFRLFPVAPLSGRLTKEDTVIGGYQIPKGSIITMNHYAASRDPRFFEDPDTFLPERWNKDAPDRLHPFGTLPFGFGTRSCVGRRFAELEMRICLLKILQQFRVQPDSAQPFKTVCRLVLSPVEQLPVRFLKRSR